MTLLDYLAKLADAAIGTAHSAIVDAGQTFTSLDLCVKFLRPVWPEDLIATAASSHRGRSIARYVCEIRRGDGTIVAAATSTVLTIEGESARARSAVGR